jgi:lipid II:glycine glycyltransferase (peptidoglycan interpeptide bridge formation enzyme)
MVNNLKQLYHIAMTPIHPLQTPSWEEFRKAWGSETVRVDSNLLTLHKVPFLNKKIAVFEKGPEPTKKMLESLKKFGRENNLIFIKLEPNIDNSESVARVFRAAGARLGKTIFTPTTFEIDLTKNEDDLLKSFSSKTRYNIRLAQRKGVTVHEDNSDKAFEKYLELTRETTQRDKFFAHSEKYHRLMWQHLKNKIAHLLVAKYQGEIVVTWILFAHDKVLYYPYGASTHKYKNIMAPNLMMWEAIKFGKKLGCTKFDLWGREPGKGFTKFKEGYNPRVVEFIGTWDLIINKPYYYLYILLDKLRWLFLRLKSKFVKPKF